MCLSSLVPMCGGGGEESAPGTHCLHMRLNRHGNSYATVFVCVHTYTDDVINLLR